MLPLPTGRGSIVEMGAGHGVDNPCFATTSDLATTIHQIEKVMTICHHATYCSDVYAKPDEAALTFVRMTDVSSYLHHLLGNETLRDNMLPHFASIEKFLSHPACEIIEQIKFDLDLIEVSNGYCFSIKAPQFHSLPNTNVKARLNLSQRVCTLRSYHSTGSTLFRGSNTQLISGR